MRDSLRLEQVPWPFPPGRADSSPQPWHGGLWSAMRGPDPRRTALSRRLRRNQTSAEQRLWRAIRNRQLAGSSSCARGRSDRMSRIFYAGRGGLSSRSTGRRIRPKRSCHAMPGARPFCAMKATGFCGSATGGLRGAGCCVRSDYPRGGKAVRGPLILAFSPQAGRRDRGPARGDG